MEMRNTQLPKVLVLSLPKSGTNLLIQLLRGIPSLTYRGGRDVFTLQQLELIKPGDICWAHNRYSVAFHRKLLDSNIKVVYISRDLRDVAVSFTHFLEKVHTKPAFAQYLSLIPTHEERLLTVIKGVRPAKVLAEKTGLTKQPNLIDQSIPSYRWREQKGICAVTFEELMKSERKRNRTVKKIASYLFPELIMNPVRRKNRVHQMIRNIDPQKSQTFRSGNIGDWKKEFHAVHKDTFKKLGGGALLVQHGYEKDNRW
ncbi:sulfotransferase domain-containing protein [Mechercharimyces sp. CAU 1602]|uniref:sulfotransferase domain-containing protein n=1 Tax=Mechercharimyces sp. CAU 1602 TaxID=2973933 RepID=UPI00216354EA|nr:sulfotransferase domain-containing protein [Mechercharimyces sp. CAU 1602]MCS1350153.1 sulfotransferase domain-containing protein [Mechercharimyces sp. CAU 1602]